MIVNIIIGIVIISVIAAVHEFGHYIAARAFKVRIEEAGLGLPPRIIGKKIKGILYSINWIPFGAFVKMVGEVESDDPSSLAQKKPYVKIIVLAAGSIMTILLALLALPIAYMVPHDIVTQPVIIKDIAADSPAERAGIEAGDTFLSVNGKQLENVYDLVRTIQMNMGEEMTVLTRHLDGTEESVTVVPRWNPPEGEGAIGVELDLEASELATTVDRRGEPFWVAIPKGGSELFQITVLYKDGIFAMIAGTAPVELVGPVGIVQMAGETARYGLSPLLEFTAIIGLILGIVNFFPLPALDGGRIIFALLEWIRKGKRVSPRVEGIIHTIGFFALLITLFAITYNDILRIIRGENLLP